MVIDDYAHHPSEVRAILNAIRSGWPDTRIVVIFQPHRYTRTRDLFVEFCHVLAEVDVLLLMNVYPAGEDVIAGADSQALIETIRANTHTRPILIKTRDELHSILPDLLEDGDILLIMGAGDIGSLGPELVAQHGNMSRQEYAN
jgi:UDP-N-acetylmuramate--alanine ligase